VLQELVKGYGVMLSPMQIDEVSIQPTPGRTIRKLTSVFFTEERLANSSCYGTAKVGETPKQQLDNDIISASISK